MEVSRIEPITFQKIDWQKLSAKKIIEFKDQGAAVPAQYLSWAQSFVMDIDADDEITYEKAHSPENIQNETQATEEEQIQDQESVENSEENETTQQDAQDMSASAFISDLKNQGMDYFQITMSMMDKSRDYSAQSIQSLANSNNIRTSSSNEIEELDSYMKNAISEIQNMKGEQNTVIQNATTVDKIKRINELQKEIEAQGVNAQSSLAQGDNNLSDFMNSLNEFTQLGQTSVDFGANTQMLGIPLLYNFYTSMIGMLVIASGAGAVGAGTLLNVFNAISKMEVRQDQSKLDGYKNQIAQETGISEAPKNDKIDEENKDESQKNLDGEVKEIDKDVKTSQNDGTDTKDKRTTDFNEIVKRRIRRGEKSADELS